MSTFMSLDLSSSGADGGTSEVKEEEVREASGGMPWGGLTMPEWKDKILINALSIWVVGRETDKLVNELRKSNKANYINRCIPGREAAACCSVTSSPA